MYESSRGRRTVTVVVSHRTKKCVENVRNLRARRVKQNVSTETFPVFSASREEPLSILVEHRRLHVFFLIWTFF